MEWSNFIGPGVVLGIFLVTTGVGLVGQWFTQKSTNDRLRSAIDEAHAEAASAKARADAATDKLGDLRLTVEREFVKKNDLAAVEDRIGRRLDQVSHDLKQAITGIIPILGELRQRRDRNSGREGA